MSGQRTKGGSSGSKLSVGDKIRNAILELLQLLESQKRAREEHLLRVERLKSELSELQSNPADMGMEEELRLSRDRLLRALKQGEHGKVWGLLLDGTFHRVRLGEDGEDRLIADSSNVDEVL